MSFWSGDYEDVNKRTMARFGETRTLLRSLGGLADDYKVNAQGIITKLGKASYGEAEKATSASVDALNSSQKRGLEDALAAAGGGITAAADAAAQYAGDRSVSNAITQSAAMKSQMIESQGKASLAVEQTASATKQNAKMNEASLLGQLQEAVDTGAAKELANLAGMYVAYKWDDISDVVGEWGKNAKGESFLTQVKGAFGNMFGKVGTSIQSAVMDSIQQRQNFGPMSSVNTPASAQAEALKNIRLSPLDPRPQDVDPSSEFASESNLFGSKMGSMGKMKRPAVLDSLTQKRELGEMATGHFAEQLGAHDYTPQKHQQSLRTGPRAEERLRSENQGGPFQGLSGEQRLGLQGMAGDYFMNQLQPARNPVGLSSPYMTPPWFKAHGAPIFQSNF